MLTLQPPFPILLLQGVMAAAAVVIFGVRGLDKGHFEMSIVGIMKTRVVLLLQIHDGFQLVFAPKGVFRENALGSNRRPVGQHRRLLVLVLIRGSVVLVARDLEFLGEESHRAGGTGHRRHRCR